MTSLKDSNDHEERETPGANDGASPANGDGENLDEAWQQFAKDHADDLNDISHSKSARQFEKHVRRKHTEPMMSVNDLDSDSFARGSTGGPRDFTGSSWLDVDETMDRFDGFTPPNPKIGRVSTPKLIFWILLIVGVFGLIATVLFPRFASVLATVFGLCALVGAAGLIMQHKGFSQTREDYFDDGARV